MAKELEKGVSSADSKEKTLTKEEKKAKKDNEKNSQKAAAAKKPKKSLKKFWKDTKSEFKKVIWPTRKQVVNNTGVVLLALVICSLGIFGMDALFSSLLKLMLNMY